MAQIPEQPATAKWQEVWATKDGRSVKVADMSEEHCRNVLNLMLKRNRELEESFRFSHDKNLEATFKRVVSQEIASFKNYHKD